MSIWRRMERISSMDRILNKEVLTKVEKDRQIMKIIQHRQHCWIGHILRHESLLLNIIERWMKGRHTRGRRRLQMLHMLAKDGCGNEVRSWRQVEIESKKVMSKTCCIAEYYRNRLLWQNFLLDIIEGKMTGTATWGRKRMVLLHDMMEGRDYGQLKDLISDRLWWRQDSKCFIILLFCISVVAFIRLF